MKYLIVILMCLSSSVFANQWTLNTGNKVGVINPGAVSGVSTFISLVDGVFTGCARSDGALLLGDNPNYDQIFSLILSAKMSGSHIRIYYGGCSGNFSIIDQAYIL
ncbi:hypothetical protein [Marinomonas sp. MED121]|uniref:hypothetical protein n=1 Tax=Marinomonas sp. MED121 TaxID=314277 RepID=UPI0002F4EDFC|nr:hypothetical protein [Marinomonas sp. MED121]